MRFVDYFDISFSTVKKNKVRSSLSILGIIIGIGAIIIVITIGTAGQAVIVNELEKFGGRRVSLRKSSRHITLKKLQRPAPLTNLDFNALRKYCTQIDLFSPAVKANANSRYLNTNRIATLYGATETFSDFNDYTLLSGRFFTKEEILSGRRVAVIGETFYDEVFKGKNAIGENIEVNNTKYTVIGIVEKEGAFADSYYMDMFDFVVVPITILQQLSGKSELSSINMLVKSTETMEAAKKEIFRILKKRHGDKAEKFYVFNELRSTINSVNKILSTASLVITIIASISLIVGGIGIMNVMLIAVLERTREIGIQKALGATSKTILLLFLSESSIIGVFGGFFGIFFGSLACIGFSYFTGIPIKITATTIFIAVVFSLGIGSFFGIFPAYKASKLDPVNALRYE